MNNGKKSINKIITVIITALTVIIGMFAAAIVINIIVCRVRNKPVSFFGYSFAIVQTPSMEPTIMTGDLIVYRTCNYSDVEEGEIIVFIAGNGFSENIQGQSVVHRVKEVTESGIITQGDNNSTQDKELVTVDNLLGICTGNSAFWGALFTVFSKYGIFVIIAIIAIPFIVGQIVKIVKLSKHKSGEDAALSGGEISGALSKEEKNLNHNMDENDSDGDTELQS